MLGVYVCVFLSPTQRVCRGVCVCFPLSHKLCFPVAILLVGLWEVGVDTLYLGKQGDDARKFPDSHDNWEPGEQPFQLTAQGQDQTNTLAAQAGDDPKSRALSKMRSPTHCPPDTYLRRERKR